MTGFVSFVTIKLMNSALGINLFISGVILLVAGRGSNQKYKFPFM